MSFDGRLFSAVLAMLIAGDVTAPRWTGQVLHHQICIRDSGAHVPDRCERRVPRAVHTELLRDLMQGYFDRCADRERRVEAVGADGIERRDARTSSRRIETPVGEIEVKRLLYQAPGVEGIAPLDAALGLPSEKYTLELRRLVAEESAKSSFDEVVELVERRTGGERSQAPNRGADGTRRAGL